MSDGQLGSEGGLETVRNAAHVGSITEPRAVKILSVEDLPDFKGLIKPADYEVILCEDEDGNYLEGTVIAEGEKIKVGEERILKPVEESHIPLATFPSF